LILYHILSVRAIHNGGLIRWQLLISCRQGGVNLSIEILKNLLADKPVAFHADIAKAVVEGKERARKQ